MSEFQDVVRGDGRRTYTVVGPDGAVLPIVDGFLRGTETGTARTYGYMLVDHLRWLPTEGLTLATASLHDLQRYMGLMGAEYRGPHGAPWRVGKRPFSQSGLEVMAACRTVDEIYGHADVNDPKFAAALNQVWAGEQ
jgi:hypothetical protein